MFEYRILGPLDARWAGELLPITAPKERDLLALLLLRADRTVFVDELIDGLWGNKPPATARTTLQNYVKRLRQGMHTVSGDQVAIATRSGGYMLRLDNASLDLTEFERLTHRAAEARQRGEVAAASARLRAALALWRGDALADSRAEHLVHVEAPRLNDARMFVFEQWVDAELRLGRHAEVVADLFSQIAGHPLRERLYVRLLVALYRSGRRYDALAAYQQARHRLIRDIGLEPGAELAATHRRILADDASLLEPGGCFEDREDVSGGRSPMEGAGWVLPAQLPPSSPAFTGREGAVRRLDMVLPNRRDVSSGAVAIGLVTGQAGVGKTALAVHWGHARRDHFPDGQLYANLHGYDSGRPARPIDVLSEFLRAFGVQAQRVPAEEESAAALYRSLCADRQLLVVLDNARSAAQVRPLLPGSSGCLVLVTSRDALGGLVARDGAVPVALDVLEPAEAEQFLAKVVGTARVRAEPEAVTALTSACACLPLAVGVMAADLVLHPNRTLADQVARLGGDRLAALRMEGDEQSAVRAVLDASYTALGAAAARMFRLLGLIPGADIPLPAAAALAATSATEAADLLQQLTRTYLLDDSAPGRYTFHDLLRAYARECAYLHDSEAERTAALVRLHQWYLASVDAAVGVYLPEALRLPVEKSDAGLAFADAGAALEWLDGERANIVAVVRHAAEHGSLGIAWTLADAIRPYMMQRAHASDWIEVASAGLAAAEADGSLTGQAAAHRSLSSAHLNQSDYEDSKRHDLRALDLYHRTGATQGQAATLNSLALTSWYTGCLQDALVYGERSVNTARRAGFRVGEAITLGNVGAILCEMGRLADAQARLIETLALCADLSPGVPTLAAITRRNLGVVLHERGRALDAVAALTEAAEMQQDRSSHIDLAYTLFWLTVASLQSGDRAGALEYIERASALKTSDTRAESDLHTARALLSHSVGNHGSAVQRFEEALALARRCGARTQELRALNGLAGSNLRLGRLAEARACAENAKAIAEAGGYVLFHAQALILLAEAELAEERPAGAARLAEQALAFCSASDQPMGRADALRVLGHARRALGEPEASLRAWQEALATYEETGAARASETRALLSGANGSWTERRHRENPSS
ncbi:AfsR/SARP family transcriptional regulator [Streptomyces sp. NPDC018693]|uniref:AfsR/SARP family transcriptional regulator n=1 Tax=unclassified Streptomyces TaxID=2593676 RepID=UPI0037BB72EB